MRDLEATATVAARARRAAWAAVLLLAAGACSTPSRHPGGTPAPSTTVAPSTSTTEPDRQYAPSPFAWQREPAPVLDVGGGPSATLSSVLAPPLDGPWLVFGTRTDAAGRPQPMMWSSPDGTTWTSGPLGGTPATGRAQAAAHYKTVTVVVGSTGDAAAQQAAVWLSPGATAPYSPQVVPATTGPSDMTLVTAGLLGMFSAGTVDGRLALWSSADGRHWSELPAAERVIGASPGARVEALLAEGDSVYAAGTVQSGPWLQPALWSTSDGLDWHLVGPAQSSFTGPGNRIIYSLSPLGTGLVAVGAIDQPSGWVPASWISPDGQSWSLPSLDFQSVPRLPHGVADGLGTAGGTAARSVSAVPTLVGPTEVVAAGGGPDGQAVWQSSDGLHWTSLALPGPLAASASWRAETAASTIDSTVVLDSEAGQPYVVTDHRAAGQAPTPPAGWSEPSADAATFGAIRPQAVPVSLRAAAGKLELTVEKIVRPQAIGGATVSTTTLVSADGTRWTDPGSALLTGPPRLPAPGALAARLTTGWAAVSAAVGASAPTWTSPTGVAWARSPA
ncbi:MAG TPA: hypothetical protein VKI19_09785, partial [Acidimicrobiales bacterium]|nr:hypothetical protein [Acidimicrobiales bacterium]